MHKGHYIHNANLQRENEQLRGSIQTPPILKNDHEVSMLKLRLMDMEDTIKRKDDEIKRLTNMLQNH